MLIRLRMVVDWCVDHPEYTAEIKVIPKKEFPALMPCEFWGIHIQAKRFELLRKYGFTGAVEAKNNENEDNKRYAKPMVQL